MRKTAATTTIALALLATAFAAEKCEIEAEGEKDIVNCCFNSTLSLTDPSQLTPTQAWDCFIDVLENEYAFTEWKQLDLTKIKASAAPFIAQATAAKTKEEKTKMLSGAIQEAISALPDYHVELAYEKGSPYYADDAKGGFTFAMNHGIDGFGIVTAVEGDPEGLAKGLGRVFPNPDKQMQAYNKGVRVGMRVTMIDGVPVEKSLASFAEGTGQQPWLKAATAGTATWTHRVTMNHAFATRAKVGTVRNFTFVCKTPAHCKPRTPFTRTLTAVDYQPVGNDVSPMSVKYADCGSDQWKGPSPNPDGADGKPAAISKPIVNEGVMMGEGKKDLGYIHVYGEEGNKVNGKPAEWAETFLPKLQKLAKDTKGLVLDIRGNVGGSDNLGAYLNGLFLTEAEKYFCKSRNPADQTGVGGGGGGGGGGGRRSLRQAELFVYSLPSFIVLPSTIVSRPPRLSGG